MWMINTKNIAPHTDESLKVKPGSKATDQKEVWSGNGAFRMSAVLWWQHLGAYARVQCGCTITFSAAPSKVLHPDI